MKTSLRFIFFALILALIATLGLSRGAWAGPLSQGTVPSCPRDDDLSASSGRMETCSASVDVQGLPEGGSASIEEEDISSYSSVPGAKFTGMAIDIYVGDADGNDSPARLEVCFPDPTGMGLIYRWWTSAEWQAYYALADSDRWVLSPTYYKVGGLTCTLSWMPGVFTIVY